LGSTAAEHVLPPGKQTRALLLLTVLRSCVPHVRRQLAVFSSDSAQRRATQRRAPQRRTAQHSQQSCCYTYRDGGSHARWCPVKCDTHDANTHTHTQGVRAATQGPTEASTCTSHITYDTGLLVQQCCCLLLPSDQVVRGVIRGESSSNSAALQPAPHIYAETVTSGCALPAAATAAAAAPPQLLYTAPPAGSSSMRSQLHGHGGCGAA
jgi:hypothetical protein